MALSLLSREEEKSRTSLIYQIKMCSLIILAIGKNAYNFIESCVI